MPFRMIPAMERSLKRAMAKPEGSPLSPKFMQRVIDVGRQADNQLKRFRPKKK